MPSSKAKAKLKRPAAKGIALSAAKRRRFSTLSLHKSVRLVNADEIVPDEIERSIRLCAPFRGKLEYRNHLGPAPFPMRRFFLYPHFPQRMIRAGKTRPGSVNVPSPGTFFSLKLQNASEKFPCPRKLPNTTRRHQNISRMPHGTTAKPPSITIPENTQWEHTILTQRGAMWFTPEGTLKRQ